VGKKVLALQKRGVDFFVCIRIVCQCLLLMGKGEGWGNRLYRGKWRLEQNVDATPEVKIKESGDGKGIASCDVKRTSRFR